MSIKKIKINDTVAANGIPAVIDNAWDNSLPDGYTRLEYLESTGTQYIDTGYKSSSNVKTELKFSPTAYAGAVYGNYSENSSVNKSNTLYMSQQNLSTIYVTDLGGTTGGAENRTKIADLTLNSTYEVSVDLKNREATANGITTNLLNTNVWTGTNNLPLFARTDAGGVIGYYGQLKLFYFRLYDNGVLVRNFIPAKRNSDSVLGMYDLVNDVFYTNSGTGTFTAGREIADDTLSDYTIDGRSVQGNKTNNLNTTTLTVAGIQSGTNYAYFNISSFKSNPTVGDRISFVTPYDTFELPIVSVDSNYVYVENKEVV